MHNPSIIGIDLGGTNVRGGVVNGNDLANIISKKINAQGSVEEVLDELFVLIDGLINNSIQAIGIGVPGLIDAKEQMVYDVVYIPSWQKVPLKKWMEERYGCLLYTSDAADDLLC